ncbi:MAG: adenosylmethionine--8-amino-7-oxononanoate transaminase [Deltaproteobacteria bacterium]|mgnify:CR=1 FL=1|nr:adenosylmethionine--8-amino-7-oxononanoate transaminase [Deltaproteobacteria bacterium]MBW1928838.1 adenosylmethionine--8-amino-7-oxononanoate transaminase [Deltaproteobacteria bacterium]MBW2026664.1 adenosylmethionine--8-amino-7-oxononanoate transaminase [Deltaproteobacteria bacterium]MBW2127238.1 adenosylmethionine--8-amino-7-oxononanoate transaminase [Deltaproteobacteria bacterium]
MYDISHFSKEQLAAFDLNHLWHPFTQMKEWSAQEPLFIVKGQGNYLIDVDGRHYLDGVSSLWANIHGHCRAEINEAIAQQLQNMAHSTLLGLSHPSAAVLARRLAELSPGDLKWVFYSESGSTAVEIALKIAFQYWQNVGKTEKHTFLCLKEGYHGDTLGSVSVGGIDLFHRIYSPMLFDSHKAPSPYLYCMEHALPLDQGAEACAKEVEKILERHHQELAGFILEPLVQGAGGILPFPPGYLKKVEELCRRYQVLLIADEVAVGFGRTGTLFACEQEQVAPDLLCVGKGLTGGYLPLAATLCTDTIFQAFWDDYAKLKTFFHGHTYTGNPLACTAALASLDLFEKDAVLDNLPAKIQRLAQGLQRLKTLPPVGDVRQMGLMAGVELFQDANTQTPYPLDQRVGHKVCMKVRDHGVILRNLGDVIVFMPPLSITAEQIDEIILAVEKAIHEICS